MADTNPNPNGSSDSTQQQATPATPASAGGQNPANQTGTQGNGSSDQPKLVPESDLIAVKKRLEDETAAHKTEIEKVKVAANDAQTQLANTVARLRSLEEQVKTAPSPDAVKQLQQQLEITNQQLTTAKQSSLEAKKQLVSSKYNLPVDNLKDYDETKLAIFEDALKLVTNKQGAPAGFAVGGGGTGGAANMTPLQRAQAIIASTKSSNANPNKL